MADNTVVHIGENSAEHVALMMTRELLIVVEQKQLKDIDRGEFLDTYAECLQAVQGERVF